MLLCWVVLDGGILKGMPHLHCHLHLFRDAVRVPPLPSILETSKATEPMLTMHVLGFLNSSSLEHQID